MAVRFALAEALYDPLQLFPEGALEDADMNLGLLKKSLRTLPKEYPPGVLDLAVTQQPEVLQGLLRIFLWEFSPGQADGVRECPWVDLLQRPNTGQTVPIAT